ncbi:MAG: hypothetical protein OXG36_09590 [Caldilineaceae bacterium]|nr:hypothetical protein [Caldilineaceae bacterium]
MAIDAGAQGLNSVTNAEQGTCVQLETDHGFGESACTRPEPELNSSPGSGQPRGLWT